MLDEFQEKTYPEGLDMDDDLDTDLGEFTMEKLFFFVREQYAPLFQKEDPVDYWGIMQYLQDNHEYPYVDPDREGLNSNEKKSFQAIKRSGDRAMAELKRMAMAIKKLYGLEECVPAAWLDKSNTKVRKYFYTQLKYADRAADPIGISVFVEMRDGKEAVLRVSLDIVNDCADDATMVRYHSHLDIPLNETADLVYVSGSNR